MGVVGEGRKHDEGEQAADLVEGLDEAQQAGVRFAVGRDEPDRGIHRHLDQPVTHARDEEDHLHHVETHDERHQTEHDPGRAKGDQHGVPVTDALHERADHDRAEEDAQTLVECERAGGDERYPKAPLHLQHRDPHTAELDRIRAVVQEHAQPEL